MMQEAYMFGSNHSGFSLHCGVSYGLDVCFLEILMLPGQCFCWYMARQSDES